MTPVTWTPYEWIEDLPGGLRLRRAGPDDTERMAAFQAPIHGSPEEPSRWEAAWVRASMSGRHPSCDASRWLIIEDRASGRIVSACGLMRHTWSLDGVPFTVGRPETVGTDPAYRRRGLIRRLFQEMHRMSEADGDLVQAIWGIPYFYRQFGYEMCIPLDGGRRLEADTVERLARETPDGWTVEPPTPAARDHAERWKALMDRHNSWASVMTSADWDYHWRPQSTREQPEISVLGVITQNGKPVGFAGIAPWSFPDKLQVLAADDDADWRALLCAVCRWIHALVQKQRRAAEVLSLPIGVNHPAWAALSDIPMSPIRPYPWYLRVPDLARFISHLIPIWEHRLAKAGLDGWSGRLGISDYHRTVGITCEQGRITEVTQGANGAPVARWPGNVLLQSLAGIHEIGLLEEAHPDLFVPEELRPVVDALFPQRPAHIWPTV